MDELLENVTGSRVAVDLVLLRYDLLPELLVLLLHLHRQLLLDGLGDCLLHELLLSAAPLRADLEQGVGVALQGCNIKSGQETEQEARSSSNACVSTYC